MIATQSSQPAWTRNSIDLSASDSCERRCALRRRTLYCERLIGTMRREFLYFVIPFGERHLRSLLKEWVAHYNQSRPHSSLGPGIPEPSNLEPLPSSGRHTLPEGSRVIARPVLGGLHHEYRLEKGAA